MLKGACLCGAVAWTLRDVPDSATACNCTACRRYGALWAYGHENEDISITGETEPYIRGEGLSFNFCKTCGCVAFWRGLQVNQEGRRRMAVNLRLTEPGPISSLPIDHFDGLEKWEDLPRDGRCIQDIWF
ncbi:hypothetical protein BurJ1DRAFT_1961 [Burkholderiales bacterium JOSHI_001]|nr:hypothetical protein BurJ1DRAFT_1961 [Burkholderiales bacterium JOSHI_001]